MRQEKWNVIKIPRNKQIEGGKDCGRNRGGNAAKIIFHQLRLEVHFFLLLPYSRRSITEILVMEILQANLYHILKPMGPNFKNVTLQSGIHETTEFKLCGKLKCSHEDKMFFDLCYYRKNAGELLKCAMNWLWEFPSPKIIDGSPTIIVKKSIVKMSGSNNKHDGIWRTKVFLFTWRGYYFQISLLVRSFLRFFFFCFCYLFIICGI